MFTFGGHLEYHHFLCPIGILQGCTLRIFLFVLSFNDRTHYVAGLSILCLYIVRHRMPLDMRDKVANYTMFCRHIQYKILVNESVNLRNFIALIYNICTRFWSNTIFSTGIVLLLLPMAILEDSSALKNSKFIARLLFLKANGFSSHSSQLYQEKNIIVTILSYFDFISKPRIEENEICIFKEMLILLHSGLTYLQWKSKCSTDWVCSHTSHLSLDFIFHL